MEEIRTCRLNENGFKAHAVQRKSFNKQRHTVQRKSFNKHRHS